METKPEVVQPILDKNKDKKLMLILSLLFDGIGMATFLIPFLGEALDVIWAPISGVLILIMYKGSHGKIAAAIGVFEELFPGLDFIPTFTLTWFYHFYISKTSTAVKTNA